MVLVTGIYCGDVTQRNRSVQFESKLLPFPASRDSADPFGPPSLAVTITDFHYLVLYSNQLRAISRLNAQPAVEIDVPAAETFRGLIADSRNRTFWGFTSASVYEILVQQEDRDVWRILLAKRQFETALRFCKSDEQIDAVRIAQGDLYFAQEKFQLAATFYAQSSRSLELTCTQFMDKQQDEALRRYLLVKLELVPEDRAMQRTMLATWIVELYLAGLVELKTGGADADRIESAQDEIRNVLSLAHVASALDPPTAYELMTGYGCWEELLCFAGLIEDLETVVAVQIQQINFDAAIDTIVRAGSADLYYKFSSALMAACPKAAVDAWIREGPRLEPRLLLPALVVHTVDPSFGHQPIRYLEYCVYKLHETDPSVHHLLLSFYARDEPNELLRFVKVRTIGRLGRCCEGLTLTSAMSDAMTCNTRCDCVVGMD